MSAFDHAKLAIVHFTGLERDALHIYVALILFFGSCLLLRWKAWQAKPVLVVMLASLIGEFLDLLYQFRLGRPMLWAESAKDFVNTCAVPLFLMLAARLSGLFTKEDTSSEEGP